MNLTPRELQVARLFALGYTWEQVMAETGCARMTVRKHRWQAYAKANVATMPELWAALGWLRVPDDMRTPGSPTNVDISSALAGEFHGSVRGSHEPDGRDRSSSDDPASSLRRVA